MLRRKKKKGMILVEAMMGLMLTATVIVLLGVVITGMQSHIELHKCQLNQSQEILMRLREQHTISNPTRHSAAIHQTTALESQKSKEYEVITSRNGMTSYVEVVCQHQKDVIEIENITKASVRFSPH